MKSTSNMSAPQGDSSLYHWLLFDLDGTLLDYDAAEAAALAEAFRMSGLGQGSSTLELYRKVNRYFWTEYEAGRVTQLELRVLRFTHLLNELGVEGDAGRLAKAYLESLGQQRMLLPGALELLQKLAPYHKMALLTNGIAEVQHSRLDASPIMDYCEHLIISGEVGIAKPEPGIFDAAFLKMGRPERKDVLMIGDNPGSDILGGQNYGLDTCWFNPESLQAAEHIRPRFTVRSLSEIAELPRMGGNQP